MLNTIFTLIQIYQDKLWCFYINKVRNVKVHHYDGWVKKISWFDYMYVYVIIIGEKTKIENIIRVIYNNNNGGNVHNCSIFSCLVMVKTFVLKINKRSNYVRLSLFWIIVEIYCDVNINEAICFSLLKMVVTTEIKGFLTTLF